MLDMALNAVKFYRNESCGKCVPCRVGSQKLVDMLTAWTQGKQNPSDLAALDELNHALALTSICGLGQIVPAPIQSVMRHFRISPSIQHHRPDLHEMLARWDAALIIGDIALLGETGSHHNRIWADLELAPGEHDVMLLLPPLPTKCRLDGVLADFQYDRHCSAFRHSRLLESSSRECK